MTPDQQDLFMRAQQAKARVDMHTIQREQLDQRQRAERRVLIDKQLEEKKALDELLGRLAAHGLAL